MTAQQLATTQTATGPTCPLCGNSDRSSAVHHPFGKYFCPCGTLFDGGRNEWEKWRSRRSVYEKARTEQADRMRARGVPFCDEEMAAV